MESRIWGKRRIALFVCVIVVSAVLIFSAIYVPLSLKLSNAWTAENSTQDNRVTESSLYSDTDGMLDGHSVNELNKYLFNSTTVPTSLPKNLTATDIRNSNFNDKGAGKSLIVGLGDVLWTVVYVSQSRADENADGVGDIIATLWTTRSNYLPELDDKTNYAGASSFYNTGSIWKGSSWLPPKPDAINLPSNMYGTSFIRAETLNNGGKYLDFTDRAANPTSATLTAQQETNHIFAPFTMANSDKYAGLSKYIVKPKDVPWQESGQSTIDLFGWNCNCSNDNWSTSVPDTGFSYNWAKKAGNDAWKDDNIWLPSVCETGFSGESAGIWGTNEYERSNDGNAECSWLRTAYSMSNSLGYSNYALEGDGSLRGESMAMGGPDTYCGVRPALHFNLSLAADDIKVTFSVVSEDEAKGRVTYNSLTPGNAVILCTYSVRDSSLHELMLVCQSHVLYLFYGHPQPGYTFDGWYIGSTKLLPLDGGGGKIITGDVYITAKFTANTYTITYNGNGATGGSTADSSHTYGVAKNLTANGYSRTGYTFLGWSTNSAATTATYTNGQSVSNLTDTNGGVVTLYAIWRGNTYIVTLKEIYPPSFASSYRNISVTFGEPMPKITIEEWVWTGYIIAGYCTEQNGQGTMYYNNKGESVRNWDIAAATTLYGDVRNIIYTITFDKQGGTGGDDSKIARYNYNMLKINVPVRAGYTFGGYYTKVNGGGTKYYNADGTSAKNWNIASNTTLYANWILNTFTVTLDKQSGTGGTDSVTATLGAALPAITLPTRTGYTFGGYYTATNGGGTQYYTSTGASARAWDIPSDTTLYAKWTAKTYTVTLNKQGGTGGTSSVPATYDAFLPIITIPTRAGYTFGGYYTTTTGGTQYISSKGVGSRTWTYTSNKTLYAKWTAKTFTVTLNKQGGAGGADSTTATFDAAMPTVAIPAKTGYTFGGYFTAVNGGGTQYYISTGASARKWDKTAATILYAFWTPNNYQVVYSHSGYKNLVGDLAGGFENTGWAGTFDTKHVRTGSYALKITGTAGSPEATIPTSTTIPIDASTKSHTFYVQYWGYQEKQIGSTDLYWPIEEPRFGNANFGAPNRWNMYSFYGTRAGNGLAGGKQLRIDFNNNGTAGEVWFDDLLFIDLTATFGAGNEPTQAWCDANITTGVTTQTFTYGQAANLAMMPTTLSGHTFAGWSKTPRTATAQPIDYTDGQSVSNLATGGTLVLYAVWQKKPLGHISANSGGVVRMENRATGAVCEAESNAGYYIIGWYINGKIYQEGGKNFVGNRLVLSVADSQSANVYVCFGTSASASPTYAYNEIRSTAVNASIGGEALLVAGDLNSMANDDTLNFAANIVASGYEFLGWFANDRLLTTDMSCRLNRATIQGFILEARFAPIDDSNINWDLNN